MEKHRNIKTLKLYNNKGLIIKFDDGSHCYITPDYMEILFNELIKLYYKEE